MFLHTGVSRVLVGRNKKGKTYQFNGEGGQFSLAVLLGQLDSRLPGLVQSFLPLGALLGPLDDLLLDPEVSSVTRPEG